MTSSRDLLQARLCVLAAGMLWSLSGFFAKALSEVTPLGLHDPMLDPMTIAFYRVLFAGFALSPGLVSFKPPRFSRPLAAMMICFAMMNWLFITAMTRGTAAGAILLQYTAPAWLALASVFFLRDPLDRRDLLLMIGGLAGVAILILGNWHATNSVAIAAALGSGMTYAGVLLGLRHLRDQPARWLTVLNFAASAVLLLPWVVLKSSPTLPQLVWLALFGAIQLALPYWLMARGLKSISTVEASLLTLIEPVLNPLWAFMISPATEKPTAPTFIGGLVILVSLAIRYFPPRTAPGMPKTSAME